MPSGIKLALCLTGALMICMVHALVPPHPKYQQVPGGYQTTRVEIQQAKNGTLLPQNRPIPNNILVLRAQFADVQFQATPSYPDGLVHDTAFFDRWMLHLADFYADASHYGYNLNYTIHPTVFTLPQTMAYYGADVPDTIDVRLKEFTQVLFSLADQEIDFGQYGGVIVFHAGPGQESDINGIRGEQIWSTFLTRKRLQSWFDPENDQYQGLATQDGANLVNIVIVPENEYQDYFPGEGEPNAEVYLFSLYGVLAHQYGHLIGLPSLFDNDSSNGASQGIGNWGLMGTGVWNASGYVPAQLDPWCRMYLGWEQAITITESATNLVVDYFLNPMPVTNRLYKLPISDAEYFLVENRQQNPDGSLDPYSNLPSYTFKLLPEGEQDYYENYPLLPFFNFMENRYIGSEWDFMLPGLGGPIPIGMSIPVDGSGLLIWHIDENVIAANFTANFDLHTVNANALHKGVDLEEADGIQHLDTAAYDQYKWGSPYDSFRVGNNDYFGNQTHNGVLSLPTAESYYGGTPLEIYDISTSGNQMSFSVGFGWRLSANYDGPNPINACSIDFDQDGSTELFYPMPDGHLYMWKDEQPMQGFPLSRMPMEHTYVWDGSHFYLPMQIGDNARLYRLGQSSSSYLFTLTNRKWATHPLSQGDALYLAMNNSQRNDGYLYVFNKLNQDLEMREIGYPIASNLVYFRDKLYVPFRQESVFTLRSYDLGYEEFLDHTYTIPADSVVVGVFMAPLKHGSNDPCTVIQCLNSIYVYDHEDQLLPGFPFVHSMRSTAPLTIEDWDKNGSLDLVFASDLGPMIIDYAGSRLTPISWSNPASDNLSISSGMLVADLDQDGTHELLGNFSFNRLQCWEQDFRVKPGFPVSFGGRSRNMPIIARGSDARVYAWVAADNGRIFRKELPEVQLDELNHVWGCEYANLERHASRDHTTLPNQYQTNKLFVPGEVYIFPNPLKSIYDNRMTLNIMTSKDADFNIKIFDINGSLLYTQSGFARAYLRNRELITLPANRFRSGVYIAVISADTEAHRIKFAVEK